MQLVRKITDTFLEMFVRRRTGIKSEPSALINWIALCKTRGGEINVGEGSILNCCIKFDSANGQVSIGSRCYIGTSLLVCHEAIHIGDDVIISWGVTIVDHDSHSPNWSERCADVDDWRKGQKNWENVTIRPVYIEEKVWIGFGVSILKGVRIGRGAVIGAGSVVTKDVMPCTVVAGNPARVIRTLND